MAAHGTKYNNCEWERCARTGGVTLALMAANGKGQGNGGTTLFCRGCWVQHRLPKIYTVPVKMSIGQEANAVFGVELSISVLGAQPLWVPISDVAQLYFYGTEGNIVDIIYLLG